MDKDMVGYLTYKASRQSSMTTTISKDTPTYNLRSSIVLGIPHSYLSLSYEHKLQKHGGRLRGLVKWVPSFPIRGILPQNLLSLSIFKKKYMYVKRFVEDFFGIFNESFW